MTRIDFYLLKADQPLMRQRYACRIAEKAFALGHRVHIHMPSAESARAMDELLWTYRDGSFVPHEVESDATDGDCPVVIGFQAEPSGDCDVLINLAPEVPLFFSRFERVAEILDENPETRGQGRERYRFYRDRGYELNHHDIEGR